MSHNNEIFPEFICTVSQRCRHLSGGTKLAIGLLSSIFIFNMSVASEKQHGDIQSNYLRDRAACVHGDTHQSKETCLREAGAARQAALAGKLESENAAQLQRNKLQRCELHSGAERESCLKLIQGEGTQTGSVEAGGVMRELRELSEPVQPKSQK